MTENCPQCGLQMVVRNRTCPRSRSRDHILPKFRGGTLIIHGDVRNDRVMCSECNTMVAQCGQCIGALACVRSVAAEQGVSVWSLLRAWKFGRIVAALIERDATRVDAEDRAARTAILAAEWRPTFGDLFVERMAQ